MIVRTGIITGAIFGFLSVATGAFGAHALKPALIQSGKLEVFELGVEYQFYHALALLITGVISHMLPSTKFKYATVCFLAGVILFSGSLYVLSFTSLGIFGLLTPMGGVMLLLGWALLAAGLIEKTKTFEKRPLQ